MTLDKWLKQNRYHGKEFAELCNVSGAMISLVKNGYKPPGRKLIARITEVTKGEVTAADFAEAKVEARKETP